MSARATTDEASFVDRARAGDRAAFGALVDAHLDATHAAVAAILADGEDAVATTRRVFVRAWHDLPRLDDPGRFEGWLGRIVVDTCRSRRPRHAPGKAKPATDPGFIDLGARPTDGGGRGRPGRGGPRVREIKVASLRDDGDRPGGPDGTDLRRTGEGDPLDLALGRLTPAQRSVLYLHVHERLGLAEVARRLGTTPRTGWSRLFDARRALGRATATSPGGGQDADAWPADDALVAAFDRRAAGRPAPWQSRNTIFDAVAGVGQVSAWRARLARVVTTRRLRLGSVALAAGLVAIAIVVSAVRPAPATLPGQAIAQAGPLAFLRDGDVYLARPDGSGAVRVLHADGVLFRSVAWSPTRALLAVGTGEAVFLLDPSTLAVRRLATGTFGAWSPDGLFVAVIEPSSDPSGGSGTVELVWVADGRVNVTIQTPTGDPVSGVAWSPDGRWLAASTNQYLLRFDAHTGLTAQLARISRSYFAVSTPAWSPDSRRLAYVDWRTAEPDGGDAGGSCFGGCASSIVIIDADGSGPTDLFPDSAMQTDPLWSPDGASIAYRTEAGSSSEGDDLWVIHLGDAKPRHLASGPIDAFAWAPDGRSITFDRRQSDSGVSQSQWLLSSVRVDDGTEHQVVPSLVDLGFASQPLTAGGVAAAIPAPIASAEPPASPEPVAPPGPGTAAYPWPAWTSIAFDEAVDDGAGSQCVTAVTQSVKGGRESVVKGFCGENFNQGLWAPDGSVYAAISDEKLVMVSRAGRVQDVPGLLDPNALFWSPDARWLAVESCRPRPEFDTTFTRAVCSWSLVTPDGRTTRAISGTPSWSADGSRLVQRLDDGRMTVGDASGTGAVTLDMVIPAGSLSPDGSQIVFVRDGDVWVVALPDGSPRKVTDFAFGGVNQAEWSRGGRYILAVRDGEIWLLSPDATFQRRLVLDPILGLSGWQWSPDDRHLAIWGWSNGSGTPETEIVSTDGSPTIELDDAGTPIWSPDGRYLAVAATDLTGNRGTLDIVNADGSGRNTVWTGVGYNLPQAWIR